ncbi:MAG: BMP family ABC transporter substrate-binding protein, partial [Clostridiaceae bacterium]|nr:BMP family ABC transporter substrate-binding protein [Clostridiaceae bacterium]
FVAGAFSALVSKNNAVGIVNGQKFPPVEDAGKGFEAGAKYVNPDIDVRVAYTDSWTDIQKAYEASLGMIEAGVDVLSSNCSDGVAGVVQAAQENDILVTGYIGDQHELAPDTIPFSSIQDIGMLIYAGIEDVINGNFKAEVIPGGAAQGVIGLSPFYQLNGEEVPQEIQNRMKEIYEGIVDGSLKASGDLPASVFE